MWNQRVCLLLCTVSLIHQAVCVTLVLCGSDHCICDSLLVWIGSPRGHDFHPILWLVQALCFRTVLGGNFGARSHCQLDCCICKLPDFVNHICSKDTAFS